MTPMTTAGLLHALRQRLGVDQVLTSDHDLAPYVNDWRGRFHGAALAVLRPAATDEVVQAMRLCGQAGVAVVPQGGNTGMCGGAVPVGARSQVVLSLQRLRQIEQVDPLGNVLTLQAGVTLAQAQEAAAAADRLFPLSLAAQGSAQVGGAIATNAGGTAVLRYGGMRDLVLGLEVVLADGQVLDLMRALRKDNTGYDLRQWFVGSEGTLGIVTRAVLKLFPRPTGVATVWLGLDGATQAVQLLRELQRQLGDTLTAFEFLDRRSLDLVLRHATGVVDPLARPHPWYVLAEVSGGGDGAALRRALEQALLAVLEAGLAQDAVLAESERQRLALWRLREEVSESERRHGASLKHDVAVPVAAMPELVARVSATLPAQVAWATPHCFGHVGDGNVHLNVSLPPGAPAAEQDRVSQIVYDHVLALQGSISAEHGIGQSKCAQLVQQRGERAVGLMRQMKQMLDPQGLLNPGKVLS
jgi:FAD/FMN-containing dehydrogenase